ncbi:unnamed protein product [Tuber aestivum]|uniref:RING-type domain-containing protein n=1 Tax=Tuber aestivum TaxID=59557 RepID=A0A292PX78_9PEZI|nr:unnamed protein product [Tuber aestivum]
MDPGIPRTPNPPTISAAATCALLLNRTSIYASLRRPLTLTVRTRFFMRLMPIALCLLHIYNISLALRCQTSEVYLSDGSPRPAGGFLWQVARVGNWWMGDLQACEAVGMIPDEAWAEQVYRWGGMKAPPESSADVEVPRSDKPVVDTADEDSDGNSVDGKKVRKEIKDMEPIKGSLALLWPFYKTICFSQFVESFVCAVTARNPAAETGMTLMEHSLAFAEAEFLAAPKGFEIQSAPSDDGTPATDNRRVLVHTEKNVPPEVLYISLISAFGHLTSHILGVFNRQAKYRLLSTGIWGVAFLSGFAWALIFRSESGAVLNFPTVCVVGFIPHLLIFTGIFVCGAIYALALVLTSLFPPPALSERPSFRAGLDNLQANLTLGTVTINNNDDFYTTLLKLGFQCLTAASEATYLNEGRVVRLPAWTWLEDQRTKVQDSQRKLGIGGGGVAPGLVGTGVGKGPYSQERKDVKGVMAPKKGRNGTGSGRWAGAGEMMRGVSVLLVSLTSRWAPVLFRTRRRGPPRSPEATGATQGSTLESEEEDADSTSLYTRFIGNIGGPLLSDSDTSGDFQPDDSIDDDASTVVSAASDIGSLTDFPYDSDDDSQPSGMRTPTQARPYPSRDPSTSPSPPRSPFSEIFSTPADLATLLDPQTPEDRAQAQVLGRHLKAPNILTRSTYHSANAASTSLESIILQQRRPSLATVGSSYSSCVVCQSATRIIIVWPCRCLALCEDCRICLAHNNYKSCVCCRQGVEGFSRIYVP